MGESKGALPTASGSSSSEAAAAKATKSSSRAAATKTSATESTSSSAIASSTHVAKQPQGRPEVESFFSEVISSLAADGGKDRNNDDKQNEKKYNETRTGTRRLKVLSRKFAGG
jgi:hypothetical protein